MGRMTDKRRREIDKLPEIGVCEACVVEDSEVCISCPLVGVEIKKNLKKDCIENGSGD